MQDNMEVDYESSLNSLVKNRASELILKICEARKQRYDRLYDKYRKERDSLQNLAKSLITLHKNINELCQRMLNLTFNLNAKSASVIKAILNNMFAEKAATDDLFYNMMRSYDNVEKHLKKIQILLFRQIHNLGNPEEMAEAESMLTPLHNDVILIHEMVSNTYEKSYRFLRTLERTRKKIDEVVKR